MAGVDKPVQVLLVDDDSRGRAILRLGLTARGFMVTDAADGREALSAVADHGPDLIVLDWEMPGMDGIQTCRLLRRNYGAPIIMMSGKRLNLKDAAMEAGADGYLAKPFSINELVTLIQSALNPPTRPE